MATKDIKQSHKEYSNRVKRIELKKHYDKMHNTKLNEIKDLDDEIERLTKIKDQRLKEANEISEAAFQALSKTYNNPDLISNIIEYASYTTFSRSNLEDIKKCQNGINIDDIKLDLLEKISSAERQINEEIAHTNLFSDFLEKIGDGIKFPGEEDDEYGN